MTKELDLLNYALRLANGMGREKMARRTAPEPKATPSPAHDDKTLPEVGRRLLVACHRRGLLPPPKPRKTFP